MDKSTDNLSRNRIMEPLKFLVFSASLEKDSLNTRLVKLADRLIQKHGGVVDFADMSEFDCASYSQDVESNGMPAEAENFRNRLLANDAYIIASPEYNSSIPGHLKNSIDWVSRFRPQPFNQRHGLLLSASPSMAGGNKGLWALRIPLEHLSSSVFPDMFSLAMAHEAFDKENNITNSKLAERFENNIVSFMDLVEAAKHYPCVKKDWVEFLGETS